MTEQESREGSYIKTSWNDLSSWMFYIMILLAVSLPLSEFGMSVAQFLLFFNWIFEGADFSSVKRSAKPAQSVIKLIGHNVSGKLRSVTSNHLLIVFLAIYVLHIIGLIYSSDIQYGLKDIRVKLPLLSIPVLLATSTSLSRKRLNILLLFFVMAVMAGSFISTYVYLTRPITDTREISIFISHIRFSLFISLSIFILFGFVKYNAFNNRNLKWVFVLAGLWLIVFLLILKSFTGIAITALLIFVVIIISIQHYKKIVIATLLLVLAIFAGGWIYMNSIYRSLTIAEHVNLAELDKTTRLGNPYIHDTAGYGIEDGKYVGLYISPDELRQEWNKKSKLDFDGLDNKGQELKYTLIRFLHTKGYRKDAEGVDKLSPEEIGQIENGLANSGLKYKLSLRPNIEQLLMGYKAYTFNKNANGSSMMQRIEYWKTSIYLIRQKPVAGHGTGDVAHAFDKAYEETNSSLIPEFRHRSHNQFLAITIALGLIGLIVFLASMFYPPVKLGKFNNYYYLIFFIIAFVSFLTEDTLETQAGATFFAFFSGLLLFGVRKEADEQARVMSEKP
ncbi:MAG TPA: O-antigen ligase family protein [Lentimicrobium sp.]|nr:O-antigen ligase family protein [Lentimicrobium sp.]